MSLFKLLAAGALGYAAYRALQSHQAKQALSDEGDSGERTPPHGDPVLAGAEIEVEPAPAAGAHSSRSFGDE
jgi:uncharacterized membrane protein YebE (DUF533 family)